MVERVPFGFHFRAVPMFCIGTEVFSMLHPFSQNLSTLLRHVA